MVSLAYLHHDLHVGKVRVRRFWNLHHSGYPPRRHSWMNNAKESLLPVIHEQKCSSRDYLSFPSIRASIVVQKKPLRLPATNHRCFDSRLMWTHGSSTQCSECPKPFFLCIAHIIGTLRLRNQARFRVDFGGVFKLNAAGMSCPLNQNRPYSKLHHFADGQFVAPLVM
jgi:hypothetical protein